MVKLTYKYSTTKPTQLLAKILRLGDFKDALQVKIDYTDTHITIETNQYELTMDAITHISDMELESIESRAKKGAFESFVKTGIDKIQNVEIFLN